MTDSYLIVRVPKSGSKSLKTVMKQVLPGHEFIKVPNLSKQDQKFSLIEHLRAFRKFTRRALIEHGVLTEAGMWDRLDHLAREKNIIVSGHIPLDEVPNPDLYKLITLIRHPVARLVSEYKWKQHGYNKRSIFNRLYHRGRNYHANKSLADYVDFLADHAELYANIATKYVTGSIDHPDPVSFVVNNYWLYGLLEHPDMFARTLSDKTGIHCSMPHVNVSPLKNEIATSSRIVDKLISFNQKDFELYEGLEKIIREQERSFLESAGQSQVNRT